MAAGRFGFGHIGRKQEGKPLTAENAENAEERRPFSALSAFSAVGVYSLFFSL
jgi:hypothetical protein